MRWFAAGLLSVGPTRAEHMFEGVNDAALIAMGDASRAESAAIARRLGYDCYTASLGRWSIMVKAFRVLIAGVASVSAFAGMAAAPAKPTKQRICNGC